MKNLNDRRIYGYIINKIEISSDKGTQVTNTQIAKELDLSVFTVRDKIIKMVKKGYLHSELDYFTSNNVYVQRRITKGDLEVSIC
jgi:predicted DNA-binding transcriptional regulator